MSASRLGGELLDEMKEESLDKLLRSLRETQTSSAPKLGILSLDRILDTLQNSASTRQQEYLYTQWSTQNQALPVAKETPPNVLEIAGATACSGKTQLLYYIIAITLLPTFYQNYCLEGKARAVVLFDLSGKFSILRLRNVMHDHLALKLEGLFSRLPNEHANSMIANSLVHLHVYRPQSTLSLLGTLASLPSYLLRQPPTHFSANRAFGLLAINDLSSFLWQDRLDAEDEAGLPATNSAERQKGNLFVERYRELVNHLRHLHGLFSCSIVATNWGLSSTTSVMGQPALRSHLPAIWNSFCSAKLVVERDPVSKFAPGISIEEALHEKSPRLEAVQKSKFTGWVNWWDSERWREEVREAVRGLGRKGRFSFWVMEQGVMLEDNDT